MNIADIISHKVAGVAPTTKTLPTSTIDKSSSNITDNNIDITEKNVLDDFPYDLNNLHPNDALDAYQWLVKNGVLSGGIIDESKPHSISNSDSYIFSVLHLNSDAMLENSPNRNMLKEGSVNLYEHIYASMEFHYQYGDEYGVAKNLSSLLDKLTSAFNPPHPNSSKVHYTA